MIHFKVYATLSGGPLDREAWLAPDAIGAIEPQHEDPLVTHITTKAGICYAVPHTPAEILAMMRGEEPTPHPLRRYRTAQGKIVDEYMDEEHGPGIWVEPRDFPLVYLGPVPAEITPQPAEPEKARPASPDPSEGSE